MIEGKAFTTAQAKFNFYDQNDRLVGVAYLDYDKSVFTLMNSSQNERNLGILKRHFIPGATDDWEVVLYDVESLDLRLFKIFSAFAVDHQDYFKKDV